MKVIIVIAALMLTLSSGITFAQGNDLDARAAATTREMSGKLGLNESSYITLKNLNRDHLAKIDEINNTYKNDAAMRSQKLAEVQQNYDTQLSSFLNTKQMSAYNSYKESKGTFTALEGEKK